LIRYMMKSRSCSARTRRSSSQPVVALANTVKTLTDEEAAQVMWCFYKEHKPVLVADIRHHRPAILAALRAGLPAAVAFAPYHKPVVAGPAPRRVA
jgi:hypothetical protein